jgi:hypothetical protein
MGNIGLWTGSGLAQYEAKIKLLGKTLLTKKAQEKSLTSKSKV